MKNFRKTCLDHQNDAFSKTDKKELEQKKQKEFERREKQMAYDKYMGTTDLKLRSNIKTIPQEIPSYAQQMKSKTMDFEDEEGNNSQNTPGQSPGKNRKIMWQL